MRRYFLIFAADGIVAGYYRAVKRHQLKQLYVVHPGAKQKRSVAVSYGEIITFNAAEAVSAYHNVSRLAFGLRNVFHIMRAYLCGKLFLVAH